MIIERVTCSAGLPVYTPGPEKRDACEVTSGIILPDIDEAAAWTLRGAQSAKKSATAVNLRRDKVQVLSGASSVRSRTITALQRGRPGFRFFDLCDHRPVLRIVGWAG